MTTLTEHSFTDALQRNGQRLYLLALSFTGSRQDAEDILQNTFLKLWQSSEPFTDTTHMDKWLTRVAVNESRSLLRRHRPGDMSFEQVEQLLSAPAPIADQTLIWAVMQLPAAQRTVIHLYYYEELSIREIASLLRMTQGAVKTRLSRGRQMLRQRLKEEDSHA